MLPGKRPEYSRNWGDQRGLLVISWCPELLVRTFPCKVWQDSDTSVDWWEFWCTISCRDDVGVYESYGEGMSWESLVRNTTLKFRGFSPRTSGLGNHTRLMPNIWCHFNFPLHVSNGQHTLPSLINDSEWYIPNPPRALPVDGCRSIVFSVDGTSYDWLVCKSSSGVCGC